MSSDVYTNLNPIQKLHVVREGSQTILPKLWEHWGVTYLVFEKDTDAYARDRFNAVMQLAQKAGVEAIVKMGRTLLDTPTRLRGKVMANQQ